MNNRAIFSSNRNYTKRLPGNSGYSSPILTDVDGDYRAYNESTIDVIEGGPQVVQDGCFAMLFVNTGDSLVIVNGKRLYPFSTVLPLTGVGDAVSIGGHLRDLYYGQINISFPAPGALPQVTMTQLFYVGVLNTKEKP